MKKATEGNDDKANKNKITERFRFLDIRNEFFIDLESPYTQIF